jgi:ferredoxin-NADP reductase
MFFIPPKEFSAKVVKKEFLNKDTVSLWFEPMECDFKFLAGQFVMIKFADPAGTEEVLTRAYSIASAPIENGQFELCVGVIPGGKGSNMLANLEVFECIEMKAPYGVCYIKPKNKNNLIMVATGTGIAPIKSILEDLAKHKDSRKIDVLFGVRTEADLFYLKQLKDLAENLEDSSIMLTLSQPGPLWTGHEGRVTAHLDSIAFDPLITDFYICGNGSMIKEVRNFALEAGIEKKNIHVEIFD